MGHAFHNHVTLVHESAWALKNHQFSSMVFPVNLRLIDGIHHFLLARSQSLLVKWSDHISPVKSHLKSPCCSNPILFGSITIFCCKKLVKCRCITIPKCLDFLGFPSSEAQPSNHRLPGGHGIFGATGAGLCRCGTVVTGAALRSWGAVRIWKCHWEKAVGKKQR